MYILLFIAIYSHIFTCIFCHEICIHICLVGKFKYTYSPDDYVIAAFEIIRDIIILFMFVLSLTGAGFRK